MRAFIIHLLLSAYVAPLIGCFLVMVFSPFLQPEPSPPPMRMDYALVAAFVAPWLVWWALVPVGCCSFLLFRLTAAAHTRGLLFWIVAWCLIGALSAGVLGVALGAKAGFGLLNAVGFIVGGLVAPFHRWLWYQLYEPNFANGHIT